MSHSVPAAVVAARADSTPAASAPASTSASRRGARWSLLYGNFVIGSGVMVVIGTLNDVSRSLEVSVSMAGQLVTFAAAVICFGAPLLAGWLGRFDRRKLLAASLAWYAIGHGLCAMAPSYAVLWPLRTLTVLGAAVFTPQAAATIGALSTPSERGRDITFVFLGWSLASVFGLPMAAWIGDTFGWRGAFVAVAVLGGIGTVWVLATVPRGIRPATLSLSAWRGVLTDRVLMAMVLVTAFAGAGQFTLFSYLAPYLRNVYAAGTTEVTLLFVWFGIFGVIGNVVASRYVDRFGAGRGVDVALLLIATSLLLWPFVGSIVGLGLAIAPWGLACFSCNSMQQARLSAAAPALASALMALNTSAIYLGQVAGAAGGGWLIAHGGYGPLSLAGLAWLALALALSVWVGRASRQIRR